MERTFTLAADVSHQSVDDTVFILDLASGEYFALNKTGAEIWRALVDGKALPDILSEMAERYGGECSADTLAKDVHEVVDDLLSRRLIIETTS